MNRFIVALTLICLSQSVLSVEIPDEFADFYDFKQGKVIIISPLGKKKEFSAYTSYENIKLDDKEVNKLFDFLIEDNLKTDVIKQIIENISNPAYYKFCDDSDFLNCFLPNKKTSFSYQYDRKILKINMIDGDGFNKYSKQYHYAKLNSSDIGMVSNLSANIIGNKLNGSDLNLSGNLYIDSKASLYYGYINNYININNNDGVDVGELSYNIDLEGNSIAIGYYDNVGYINNAISDYEYRPSMKELKATLYSSDNLLIGDESSYKKIYFNMPDDGYVKFYHNGKVFKNKHYSAGQNQVTYSELPYGNYKLKLEFIVNGKEYGKPLYINIYNSKSNIEGVNYKLEIAKTEKDKPELIDNIEKKHNSYNYAKLGLLYGFDERIGLLSEAIFSDDANIITAGLIYNSDFDLLIKNSFINDEINGNRFEASVQYGNINIDYETLNYNDDVNKDFFSGDYFGYYDYVNWSFTYSTYIDSMLEYVPSGMIYFNYNHIDIDKTYEISSYKDYSLDLFSMSYNFNYHDNSFNFMMSQSYYGHMNELSVNFDINIPLGNDWETASSISHSNRMLMLRSELSHLYNTEHGTVRSSVYSNYRSGEPVSSGASIDTTYQDRYQNFSGSFDANSDGSSVYAVYDTSLLISNNDILLTGKKNNSYLVIDTDSYVKSNSDYGTYELNINNGERYSRGSISNQKEIIGTNDFNKYDIILDTESSGLENNGERIVSYFSHPGSIKYIKPKLSEIKTYIVSFEFFNGDKVDDISCEGSGCSSYSEVGDGVYSLSVKVGEAFKIYSKESICFVEQVSDNTNLGISKCFPSIQETDGMQLVTKGLDDERNNKSYYIGIYSQDELAKIKSKLDGEIVVYNFNGKDYVFWQPDNIDNENNRAIYNLIAKSDDDYENYASVLK
ncbi:TcfC E-set like domain-containing protein [Photobacterium damselae]|uniref:TcfC E-set like domain-containing protein n=1 Tax=Photobacterium damselae TaxID=38293 RepID=UPI004068789E